MFESTIDKTTIHVLTASTNFPVYGEIDAVVLKIIMDIIMHIGDLVILVCGAIDLGRIRHYISKLRLNLIKRLIALIPLKSSV